MITNKKLKFLLIFFIDGANKKNINTTNNTNANASVNSKEKNKTNNNINASSFETLNNSFIGMNKLIIKNTSSLEKITIITQKFFSKEEYDLSFEMLNLKTKINIFLCLVADLFFFIKYGFLNNSQNCTDENKTFNNETLSVIIFFLLFFEKDSEILKIFNDEQKNIFKEMMGIIYNYMTSKEKVNIEEIKKTIHSQSIVLLKNLEFYVNEEKEENKLEVKEMIQELFLQTLMHMLSQITNLTGFRFFSNTKVSEYRKQKNNKDDKSELETDLEETAF